MDEAKLLRKLDELRLQISDDCLNKPEGQTEFYYGHAVGLNHGLRRVKALIEQMLNEEDEKNV